MSIVVQRNYQIREPVETHQTARKILMGCIVKAGTHLFYLQCHAALVTSDCGVT